MTVQDTLARQFCDGGGKAEIIIHLLEVFVADNSVYYDVIASHFEMQVSD